MTKLSVAVGAAYLMLTIVWSQSARVASALAYDSGWQSGIGTWYGAPNGDGSEDGACGYGNITSRTPFSSRITAVGPALFKEGKGCGQCYQIKCEANDLCSETPVTVVVTDECPECTEGQAHFDLSGTAFFDMAFPGRTSELRNSGIVNILFKRVQCQYPGKNIAFHVNAGSNDYWFSVLIEFENGDGDLGAVYLKQANSESWEEMEHLWGAYWALNSGPLKAPFSIRLQTLSTGRTLTANDVIPQNWQPDATYVSLLNYN
uniref:Expansin-like EG45 domain-containing protein n=1 Tax=Araucaria cunninghamii TaxID=56994 RepID=A0A0D6QWZ6_ARACU